MYRRNLQLLAKGIRYQFLLVTVSCLLHLGCDSMVSDWIGGGRFSSNPSTPSATTATPSLKLSGLPTSTPDGYPISGIAQLENATSAVTYSVFNDSCSGVEINSTSGTVSGVVGGTVGNTCTFQIRATSDAKQYDSSVQSVTVTAGFTVSFAKTMISLNKGDAPVTVNLVLTTAAPFNTYLKYKLYSVRGFSTALYGFGASGTIYVPAGSTQVPIVFELKSNSVLSGIDFQTLQIEDGGSNPLPSLLINLASTPPPVFSKISAGPIHTCGITGGKLFCWGSKSFGILGDGNVIGSTSVPTQVGSSTTWQEVSTGDNHTCGINAGALYCWGSDSSLQVGNGAATGNVTTPLQIGSSTTWQQISAGYSHTCGIDAGKLFCWGNSGAGQVGYGGTSTTLVDAPLQIGIATNWQKVAAGKNSTCGIESGLLYCWGSDSYGQQGNGSGSSANVLVPTQIGALTNWQDISMRRGGLYTEEHACGIAGGAMYCWGNDTWGEMGNGAGSAQVTAPQQIGTSTTWTQISAGSADNCGLDAGKLFCWGNNDYWKLGVSGSIDTTLAPVQVGTDSDWTHVSAGGNVSCGIRNNTLYCWGGQSNPATGRGTVANFTATEPNFSVGPSINWQSVGGNGNMVCGVESGRLYCWGLGQNGMLGNTINDINYCAPSPEQIGKTKQWHFVARGNDAICAISNGQLYCWGQNGSGQVGIGSTTTPITTPNRVGVLSNWTTVSIGTGFACGIAGGKLYCWGSDFWGQQGNGPGSTTAILSPQQIGSSTTWQAVSAGATHVCGIDAGQLYCWGSDLYEEQGNGATTGAIDTPTLIDAATTWQKVSAGGDAACALKAGALYCWGRDNFGQQGNGPGSSTNVLVPTQIGASTTWQEISMSATACGIDAGALFCWGSDSFGQVGNGPSSSTNVTAPAQVGALTNWQKVTAIGTTVCGISGGQLFCWGNSKYLQLGISTPASFPQPLIDF